MKRFKHLFLLSLTIILAACASKPIKLEGNYELSELKGSVLPENANVTMTITPDRIGGKGPINNWSGPLQNGTVGMLISTKMAGPPELMEMETAFYQAIDGAMLELDGDRLNLVKDGEAVATFERTE